MTRNEIVLGLDDSPSAKTALGWAAEQAIRRQTRLRAIHVLDWPYGSSSPTVEAAGSSAQLTFEAAQAAYVANITGVFDASSPRPDWLVQFATGEPGPVLVKQSRESQLLVVGTREHVGLGRLLTGSISHYCLSNAACPVVSVPTLIDSGPVDHDQGIADTGPKTNKIIVGIDSSRSARAALRWAAEQVRATGQGLWAIHAVDVSRDFNLTPGIGAAAVTIDVSAIEAADRNAISAVFESIQPEAGWGLDFFAGEAGPVLVAESSEAPLLVVGTRQHRGIGRLVSGSVSHFCLSHAQCSVAAVPAVPDPGVNQDHDQAGADQH
jgi:nucleotide-binding universal stress UspA family protein